MSHKLLMKTASELPKVSIQSCKGYEKHMEFMVAQINRQMMDRMDLDNLIGKSNSAMMKDNHENHARFICSYIYNPIPEVLVNTVLWVFRAYRTHGFSSNYWAAQLNAWIKTLKETLPEKTFQEIYPLYNWLIINIPVFVQESDIQLKGKVN